MNVQRSQRKKKFFLFVLGIGGAVFVASTVTLLTPSISRRIVYRPDYTRLYLDQIASNYRPVGPVKLEQRPELTRSSFGIEESTPPFNIEAVDCVGLVEIENGQTVAIVFFRLPAVERPQYYKNHSAYLSQDVVGGKTSLRPVGMILRSVEDMRLNHFDWWDDNRPDYFVLAFDKLTAPSDPSTVRHNVTLRIRAAARLEYERRMVWLKLGTGGLFLLCLGTVACLLRLHRKFRDATYPPLVVTRANRVGISPRRIGLKEFLFHNLSPLQARVHRELSHLVNEEEERKWRESQLAPEPFLLPQPITPPPNPWRGILAQQHRRLDNLEMNGGLVKPAKEKKEEAIRQEKQGHLEEASRIFREAIAIEDEERRLQRIRRYHPSRFATDQ